MKIHLAITLLTMTLLTWNKLPEERSSRPVVAIEIQSETSAVNGQSNRSDNQIFAQTQPNPLISAGIIGMLAIIPILLYYLIAFRKQKKTALRQLGKYEEMYSQMEKDWIKKRQSPTWKLHEDILQNFFALRFGLQVLNNKNDSESIKKRYEYLDMLQNIEKQLSSMWSQPQNPEELLTGEDKKDFIRKS